MLPAWPASAESLDRNAIDSVRRLVDEHHYKQAEALLADLSIRFPGNMELSMLRGKLLKQTGRVSEASSVFADAAQLDPQSPFPLIELAQLSLKQLDFDTSLSYAQQAVARDPSCLSARITLIDVLLACEQTAEAERQLKCLPEQFKDKAELELLAYRLSQKKGDLFGASNHLHRAIAVSKNHLEPRLKLEECDLLESMSDYQGCRRVLEEIIAANPDTLESRLRLARLLETHYHDFAGAFLQYEEALRLDPLSAPALAGRERCRVKRRNLALAIKVALRDFCSGISETPGLWPLLGSNK